MAGKVVINEVILQSPNGLVEKSVSMGDDGIVKVNGVQVADVNFVNSEVKKGMSPYVKNDSLISNVLVAEIYFTNAYQRESLVFTSIAVGTNVATDSSLTMLSMYSGVNNTTLFANNYGSNTANIQIVTVGNKMEVWVKQTGQYLFLHIALLSKSTNVVWKV